VQNQWTALHWSAKNGHILITKKLLDAGANVTLQNKVCTNPYLPSIAWMSTRLTRRPLTEVCGACVGVTGWEDCASVGDAPKSHGNRRVADGGRGNVECPPQNQATDTVHLKRGNTS
jgi:ankyrin repeat protein